MKRIFYRNLEAELTRANVNRAELAAEIGISLQSLNNKLRQKTEFTLDEMDRIKQVILNRTGQEFTLDYLFERGE